MSVAERWTFIHQLQEDLMASVMAEYLLKDSGPRYSYFSNAIKKSFDNYYESFRVEVSLAMKLGNSYNKAKTDF